MTARKDSGTLMRDPAEVPRSQHKSLGRVIQDALVAAGTVRQSGGLRQVQQSGNAKARLKSASLQQSLRRRTCK